VHVLISAGGLTLDGTGFKQVAETFLLPLEPLAELFKKKMMDALREMRSDGLLLLTDGLRPMTDANFAFLVATLANQDWNVYLKPAFRSPKFVLEYYVVQHITPTSRNSPFGSTAGPRVAGDCCSDACWSKLWQRHRSPRLM
jgi:hypothetical protein